MKKKKYNKVDQALFDCYTELYENSTPSASFQELMDNATLNERGEKVIPFDDYLISEELFDEIVKKHSKQFKGSTKRAFSVEIHLGCSPKYKQNAID